MSARTRDSAGTALHLQHWHDVPRDCASSTPGVGHGNERVMDLSARATTPDQQRIEAVLEEHLEPGARILHVGVGNSSLACHFAARAARIVGLTLSSAEKQHGDALGIAGYSILLINKYSPELETLHDAYDVVVDNNLASFGCCVRHFEYMLMQYARLLVPGGSLLTDRAGMHWTYQNGPMRLNYEDLQSIAEIFPFIAQRITPDVFALRRRT